MATSLPTGTVTFLFTDIEGSTRLLTRLGAGYPPLLARHNAIVRGAVAAHHGVEVKTEGDSFFCVFARAPDALAAAVEAQRALAVEPWPAESIVRVRMGLHAGVGELSEGDYVGLDVHRAARVAAAASMAASCWSPTPSAAWSPEPCRTVPHSGISASINSRTCPRRNGCTS